MNPALWLESNFYLLSSYTFIYSIYLFSDAFDLILLNFSELWWESLGKYFFSIGSTYSSLFYLFKYKSFFYFSGDWWDGDTIGFLTKLPRGVLSLN